MERWERADKFGLSPPKEVKDLIKKNIEDERYSRW